MQKPLNFLIIFILCGLFSETTFSNPSKNKKLETELDQTLVAFETLDGHNPELVDNIKQLQQMSDEELIKRIKSFKNPYTNLSKQEVDSIIMGHLKDSKAEELLVKYPKAKDFVVETVRDEKALGSLFNIVGQKEKLKNYAISVLVIVILGYIFKNIIGRKRGFFFRLFKDLIIFIVVTSANFGAFFYIFEKEVTPLALVAKRVFLD